MRYLEELGRELSAAGIPGRLRRRIAAEFEDHLACDPEAELGEPRILALRFADELGAARARRAAGVSFGALVAAGVLFAACFLLAPRLAFGAGAPGASVLGRLGAGMAVLASQVAFIAGGLAALRARRRRRATVLPRAEAAILVRRAAVGVAFGLLTMIGLGLLAVESRPHLSASWSTLAEVAAGVGSAALAASIPALVAAFRLAPRAPGPPGDIFSDLGPWIPRPLRGRPWRFALVTAALAALLITAAGVAGGDPIDGGLRGIADGTACLAGFAVLGPFLGLWTRRGARVSRSA